VARGHGSAKTLLLARLAEALGLVFCHYNAPILSFNDLLAYPVPQDGRLVCLDIPATMGQAEAVLFDEVSRCRPELQNKLFPLVHEPLAQGDPVDPANLNRRAWSENARKGWHEGEYLKQRRELIRKGLTPAQAEWVLED
jgi:hypothetical protein